MLDQSGENARVLAPFGDLAGVGQDDDVRLQPLGAMDRHDADLIAALFHVALDNGVLGLDPGKKSRQRGGTCPLSCSRHWDRNASRGSPH